MHFNPSICKWCGKKGFKKIKEIKLSGNRTHDFMNDECLFCKGRHIDKSTWDIWKQRGWTTRHVLKKKAQKILELNDGSLSSKELEELFNSKQENFRKRFKKIKKIKKIKRQKKNIIKNTIFDLGQILIIPLYLIGVVVFWSLFLVSPLAGAFFLIIVGSWYLVIRGDLF